MTNLLLLILVLGPIALTYFLKSNAALAYLALCAGFVLLSLTTSDLQQLLDHSNIVRVSTDTLGLILLASPPLLTLLLTRRAVHGQSNVLIQLIPALFLGGLLALIGVPLLNESARGNFTGSSLWTDLQKIQSWVIGAGALSSLLLVWSTGFRGFGRRK